MPAFLLIVLALVWALPADALCVGDCNGDNAVAINELVIGVGIALGGEPVTSCPAMDADDDGNVAIAELVSGVNNALGACTGAPTATTTPPRSTPTRTATPSATATPTVTATPAIGPVILFIGISNADDSYSGPTGTDPNGVPIYERPFGFGFSLVVEAGRGSSNRAVGSNTFADGASPDLQVQATRPLGDGSGAVCDGESPTFGGVPAINPPMVEDPDAIADALNDFGCRFINGQGNPIGRSCELGCIRFESGEYGCQSGDEASLQFCANVSMPLTFPAGDTLVTARVRDEVGNLGAPKQVIVRVAPPK